MECCLSLFALDCWPLFALDCSYRFAFTNAYGDTKLVHRLCHFLTTISRYAEPYSKRTFESEDSCRLDKCPWYTSWETQLQIGYFVFHAITIRSPVVLSHLQRQFVPNCSLDDTICRYFWFQWAHRPLPVSYGREHCSGKNFLRITSNL